jgi:predicted DNA-binding protein (UPF0251 family)
MLQKATVPRFEKFEKIALAVVEAKSLDEAAKLAGISRMTLHRYMRNEYFLQVLDTVRRQAHAGALSILAGQAEEAARRLIALMNDPGAPPGVRLSACKEVLAAAKLRLIPESDKGDVLEALRGTARLLGDEQ